MSKANKPLIALIALMAIFSSVGFSAFTSSYFDNFQTYSTPNDTSFIKHYKILSNNFPNFNNAIEQAPPYVESLAYHIYGGTQRGNGYVWIQINETEMNITKPFTFSFILQNSSTWRNWQQFRDAVSEFDFLFYGNVSNKNNLNWTQSHGYLMKVKFPAVSYGSPNTSVMVELSRCPANMSIDFDNSYACPQILSQQTFQATGAGTTTGLTSTTTYNSGFHEGSTTWTASTDVRFKLVALADGTIKFFMNPANMLDVQRFSYNDTSPIWNNGTMSIAYRDVSSYADYATISLLYDDMKYENTSTYLEYANLTMVSYPDRIPHKLGLIEMANNTYASWIPLNLPFDVALSFNTPAGEMNSITDSACPVRLFLEERCDADYCYFPQPQIVVKASTPADANKCIRRIEWNADQGYIYTPALFGVPLFCYGVESCLWTWADIKNNITRFDQVIGNDYVASGQWNTAYKIIDYNGKWLYRSVDYVCSSPANLTFAIQYIDKKACAGTSTMQTDFVNITIGVFPNTSIPCDYQFNASCFNGSTNVPSTPPDEAGNHTLFCELNPTNANCLSGGELYCQIHPEEAVCITGASQLGITDIYDSSQSGGIVGMILSPAFIGMMVCVIVGSAVGYVAGPLVGVCGFIGAMIICTGFGLFPIWISFAIIALTAFATASLIKSGFTS